MAPDVLRIPPPAPIKEALTVFTNRQDRRDEVQSGPIAYAPHSSHGITNNHKQEGREGDCSVPVRMYTLYAYDINLLRARE